MLKVICIFLMSATLGADTFYQSGTFLTGNYTFDPIPDGVVYFQQDASMGTAQIVNNTTVNMQDISTCGQAVVNNNFDLLFFGNSSAGSAEITNNGANLFMQFFDNSTAGESTIVNNIFLNFRDASSAGRSHITNNGQIVVGNTPVVPGVFSTLGEATVINNQDFYIYDNGRGGTANIQNNQNLHVANIFPNGVGDAENAHITNNNALYVYGSSTLGDAEVTQTSHGFSYVYQDATADGASFMTAAGGVIDISGMNGAGVTIGSIDGAADIHLGSKKLTLGGLNKNNTLSGIVSDLGFVPGVGGSLKKVGTGTLTFSGLNTYTGTTEVVDGVLRAGGVGVFSPASDTIVELGAILDLAGYNQTLSSLINQGVVTFNGSEPGTVLTIASNLNSGSGIFRMKTNIGAGVADHLTILGGASGNYLVSVTNSGGAPVDPKEPLELISTVTNPGQFSLVGGYLNAGPYVYTLELNSNNWYLVNTFRINNLTSGIVNTMRSMTLTWFAENGTLIDRLGDLRLQNRCDCRMSSLWVKGFGQGIQFDDFDNHLVGGEIGADCLLIRNLYTGLFFGLSETENRFLGRFNKGHIQSCFGGVYATWVSPSGFYLDLIGKVDRFKSRVKTSDQELANWQLLAPGGSIEVGYAIGFSKVLIEPQVQVAYVYITGSDFESVSQLRACDALQLRGSVLASYTFSQFNVYVRGSAIEQVSTGGEVIVWDKSFRPNVDGLVGEVDVGLIANLGGSNQIYANYQAAFGKEYTKPWGCTLGVRQSF